MESAKQERERVLTSEVMSTDGFEYNFGEIFFIAPWKKRCFQLNKKQDLADPHADRRIYT